MTYYLGIDAGGTKTTCAVGDESKLLATAGAGPANVLRVGEATARESLHQAVREAGVAAGITLAQVACTCIGAAGAARAEIAGIVRRILQEILPPSIHVVGDMEIALEAAFGTGPGVIVNAGTGSFAYGRNTQGATARAGGWGFAIGDEGSAHWIGRTAITAALRASDLGKGTDGTKAQPLLDALMKAWGVGSVDDLIRAANATPAPDFSALFPVIVAAAEAGDEVARQVLTKAGTELGQIAAIVIGRLFPVFASESGDQTAPGAGPLVPVATVGGVFRHASLVREVFYNEVRRLDGRAEVNPKLIDPVEGALRLARKSAGVTR